MGSEKSDRTERLSLSQKTEKKKKDALRLFPLQIEFGDLRGVLSGPLEALTGKRSSASTSMFHDAQNELNVEGPCPLRVSWHKTRT